MRIPLFYEATARTRTWASPDQVRQLSRGYELRSTTGGPGKRVCVNVR
jgi:hypothetical protein